MQSRPDAFKAIIVDEQNSFRSDRSCQDHVFSACTVIRDRLSEKKSTFATFIDLQKAFDLVDRDALLYKLLLNKIDGKFYNSVKALYTNVMRLSLIQFYPENGIQNNLCTTVNIYGTVPINKCDY